MFQCREKMQNRLSVYRTVLESPLPKHVNVDAVEKHFQTITVIGSSLRKKMFQINKRKQKIVPFWKINKAGPLGAIA